MPLHIKVSCMKPGLNGNDLTTKVGQKKEKNKQNLQNSSSAGLLFSQVFPIIRTATLPLLGLFPWRFAETLSYPPRAHGSCEFTVSPAWTHLLPLKSELCLLLGLTPFVSLHWGNTVAGYFSRLPWSQILIIGWGASLRPFVAPRMEILPWQPSLVLPLHI